jgi:hypothetical protein
MKPQGSTLSVPEGTGSAQALSQNPGRVAHMIVEDRVRKPVEYSYSRAVFLTNFQIVLPETSSPRAVQRPAGISKSCVTLRCPLPLTTHRDLFHPIRVNSRNDAESAK